MIVTWIIGAVVLGAAGYVFYDMYKDFKDIKTDN